MRPTFSRLLLIVFLSGSAMADEAPPFRRLEIESPRFTADQVGLIQLECEKVATFLSVYAYRNFREGIQAGAAPARIQARRFLALALHLDPHNIAAGKINDALADGKQWPEEIALPQDPKLFAESAWSLIRRLRASTQQAAKDLAGFLSLVAADVDPTNEDVVHAAEVFLREDAESSRAWKNLASGRRKTDGS